MADLKINQLSYHCYTKTHPLARIASTGVRG